MDIACCSAWPPPPLLLVSRAPFRREDSGQHNSPLPARPQNPGFPNALSSQSYQCFDITMMNCKQGAVGVGIPILGLPSWRHPQIKSLGSQGPLQLRLFIQNRCGPNSPQCKALSGSGPTGAPGFWRCLKPHALHRV